MNAPRLTTRAILGVCLVAGLAITGVSAQRGGGGAPSAVLPPKPSRLDILTAAFTLDKNQTNQVKLLLDAAHKNAAPIRQQLLATYTALGAAIQAGKTGADLDAAVKAYAAQATAMAGAEMKALAACVKTLSPTQRENTAAVDTAFYMMHGIFLDDKKWNIIPDGKTY